MTFPRGAWERSPAESPAARWEAGPAGRAVRGRAGFRGSKQPFGAEPVGGVRNREKGASCLSAASSCPAGSAARRPGSSQRQGCPFFWFFSLGRQRKERHPARGRRHPDGAGAPWSPFPRWSVGTIPMAAGARAGSGAAGRVEQESPGGPGSYRERTSPLGLIGRWWRPRALCLRCRGHFDFGAWELSIPL